LLLGISIRHALLALLSEGPKYGLQLRQEFESRAGEVWPLNAGQVCTTLQRLERDSLVASGDAGGSKPRNPFTITDSGSEELQTWLLTPPDVRLRIEAIVRWLDTAEARLSKVRGRARRGARPARGRPAIQPGELVAVMGPPSRGPSPVTGAGCGLRAAGCGLRAAADAATPTSAEPHRSTPVHTDARPTP
jgi:DNA-binding PadR family transcriptional regulator